MKLNKIATAAFVALTALVATEASACSRSVAATNATKWVVLYDEGAKNAYFQQIRSGWDRFEALKFRLGHDRNAQTAVIECRDHVIRLLDELGI